ncbi:DNA-binding protein [Xylona heveae TC161]|uniref:DNA-binding protein n=1 Tax=Xylona heveae (strain CBS 132557 / TC161) TaxID=1328760 RepID=A0A164ZPZ2_XYLHT|nr:DNA-binding protein [Xylona heveae TC161]KZF19358.1 DNA-binding protein [Xylona heveae TC161]
MAGVLDTYQGLVSTFGSFLTVSIHTILYERAIYPTNTFITARKYNYPVRQNRHPKVCKWIQDAVAAVEAEMLKATVARVAVLILSPDSVPLERFMFDVSGFPSVPASETLTPFAPPGTSAPEATENRESPDLGSEHRPDISPAISTIDLEEQFRGVMSRLAFCGSSLGPLPEGCTFTVCIELKDEADAPIGHPQPWIPSQPSLQRSRQSGSRPGAMADEASLEKEGVVKRKESGRGSTTDTLAQKSEEKTSPHPSSESSTVRTGSDLGGVRSTPLRSVAAGELSLEMWIEEAKGKMQLRNNTKSAEGG